MRLGIHCVYKASSFASARVIAWLGASVNEIRIHCVYRWGSIAFTRQVTLLGIGSLRL